MKMVQPSPLPHGWGWRLTPSWEDWLWLLLWRCGQRKGGGPGAAVGPYRLLQLRGKLRASPPPVHRSLHTGKPSQRWGSWEVAQVLGPMLPEVRQLAWSVSADPPVPLPHPVLYLVLLSSRQEAETRHLKPAQALLSAPGTLQQLIWVLLPGWEGRVQWGGLSDISLRNVLGRLEVATVEAVTSPWRWEGRAGL